ncbi:MAG: SRPBCC family protein [Alphaproteobacteria bacterium]
MRLAASADSVWTLIGPFDSLPLWHPLVRECTLAYAGGHKLRRILLHDGRRIVNREEARDEAKRSYSYSIVEAPVAVTSYLSTLTVHEEGPQSCLVHWESAFVARPGADPEDERRMVESLVRPGLENLGRLFGRTNGE